MFLESIKKMIKNNYFLRKSFMFIESIKKRKNNNNYYFFMFSFIYEKYKKIKYN